jgi:hypothetical protein
VGVRELWAEDTRLVKYGETFWGEGASKVYRAEGANVSVCAVGLCGSVEFPYRKAGGNVGVGRAKAWAGLAALLLVGVCAAGVCMAGAQESVSPDLAGALKQGHLTVWIVVKEQPHLPKEAGVPVYNTPSPGYHEQTTAGFGQNSNTYGHDASDYGVPAGSSTISAPTSPTAPQQNGPAAAAANAPAGSGYKEEAESNLGQPSGSYGQSEGNYGESVGKLGQSESSLGTNAGNYGQSVGKFGNTMDTIAEAGTNMAKRGQGLQSNPLEDKVRGMLAEAFPDLSLRFVVIPAEDLAEDLRVAHGTERYPDVLMGVVPKGGVFGRASLAMLQQVGTADDGVTDEAIEAPEFVVMEGAPHLKTARAFADWVSEDGENCRGCIADDLTKEENAAAHVSVVAVQRMLRGEGLGDVADVDMAPFPRSLGRTVLVTEDDRPANMSGAEVEVVKASVNGKLAAVTLRVVPSSRGVLGVAHSLVILRLDKNDAWRVLHIALNMPAVEAENERSALMEQCTERICGTKSVTAVAIAYPADGAQVQTMPQLWWDNGGGSGMEVVEWEVGRQGEWTDARLYLMPDRGAKLRTEVVASFADHAERYRWRVWSIGEGGVVKMTAWHTFRVEQ